jgi:hypothetical protein
VLALPPSDIILIFVLKLAFKMRVDRFTTSRFNTFLPSYCVIKTPPFNLYLTGFYFSTTSTNLPTLHRQKLRLQWNDYFISCSEFIVNNPKDGLSIII